MSNTPFEYNIQLESVMIPAFERMVRESVGDHVWFNWHRVWYWNVNSIDDEWIKNNIKGSYRSGEFCWFFADANDYCLFMLTYC